jgi:Spy/CpxP family protein refolding chaperone
MKLIKLPLVLVCGSLMLGVAQAQEQGKKGGRGGGAGGPDRAQMEKRNDEMLDKVGLTAEQKEKFKALQEKSREENREKYAGLRDKSPEERREAMQKIQDDLLAKAKEQKIMTDEQIAKYKELRQQMMQQFMGGGKGGKGGKGGEKKQ